MAGRIFTGASEMMTDATYAEASPSFDDQKYSKSLSPDRNPTWQQSAPHKYFIHHYTRAKKCYSTCQCVNFGCTALLYGVGGFR